MLVDTLLTVSRKHYRSKNGLSYRQYGQLSASLCRGRDDTHIKVTVLNTKTRPFSVIATPKVQKYLMEMKRKFDQLGESLSSNTLSPNEMASVGKQYAELSKIVGLVDERESLHKERNVASDMASEAETMQSEDEMKEFLKMELEQLDDKIKDVDQEIIELLTPKDDADERGVVIEVRAGTGGDEASLFASEIFRMYQRYAALMRWKWVEMSFSKSEIGGFKEAQANIKGDSVFKHLKYEAGVHRVQRIPINDTKIQTSAASVIVLPEAEELDVEIRQQDLKIDVFRAGGAGGQHVNTTESAVRITHLPTGIVVSMQDERSQIQNRSRAMEYLRARLYDHQRTVMMQSRNELRTAAQGTGDRSDKIRTYNFPQDRVSDHRIGLTVSNVAAVLSGQDLQYLIDGLIESDEKEKLVNFLEKLEDSTAKMTKSKK